MLLILTNVEEGIVQKAKRQNEMYKEIGGLGKISKNLKLKFSN